MGLIHNLKQASRRAAVSTSLRAGQPPHATRESLANWTRQHLGDRRVVIVSNRQPYSHTQGPNGLVSQRNAGGLTVALDAVAQAIGGVWVAHGSGDGDREAVDAHDRVGCPPGRTAYTLRRMWLSPEDHERYYAGFANGALWPLCHIVYVRPRFERADWEQYEDVNRRFAEAVLEEIGDEPALVFVQDYHLARMARYLRAARPDLQIALFWHIPWPNSEVLRRLPWRDEVLDGMLACDLIGFHIPYYTQNFLHTVADSLEARVDLEHHAVVREGHRTLVRDFPIGTDPDEIGEMAERPETARAIEEWRRDLGLGDASIGLGIDRMDYTKGIPERLEALERFYELHPEWREKFRFVQVAVPSRIELSEYQAVAERVRTLVNRINTRFASNGLPLVHLIERNLDFPTLVPLYRMADLCMVTALHDGMNLVAKEYVAARTDLNGALILSPFTGAARDLARAWIVSPYERDDLAGTIAAALTAPPEDRTSRMRDLRSVVYRRTIYDWATEVLDAARTQEGARPRDGSAAEREVTEAPPRRQKGGAS